MRGSRTDSQSSRASHKTDQTKISEITIIYIKTIRTELINNSSIFTGEGGGGVSGSDRVKVRKRFNMPTNVLRINQQQRSSLGERGRGCFQVLISELELKSEQQS